MSRAGLRFVALLTLTLASIVSVTGAHAQKMVIPAGDPVRLIRQIESLQGSPDSPTGFTLQLGTQSWDLKLAPKATIKAQSAEADVEGLVNDDYAVVTVIRIKKVLTATRILYDVQPVLPLRVLTGTVTRVAIDGKHFTMKSDQLKVIQVRLPLEARFRMDGRVTDVMPTLTKGDNVQILARHGIGVWIAYDLNLRSTGTPGTARA